MCVCGHVSCVCGWVHVHVHVCVCMCVCACAYVHMRVCVMHVMVANRMHSSCYTACTSDHDITITSHLFYSLLKLAVGKEVPQQGLLLGEGGAELHPLPLQVL